MPKISIGQPEWWSDQTAMGENWNPPDGGKRYCIARFAFSIRPEEGKKITRAELIVSLDSINKGQNPVIFDLIPRTISEEQTGAFTMGIGPEFKFASVDASLTKAEMTINLRQAVPIIVVDGIGEHIARWIFISHKAHPLIGSQITYAVIELPKGIFEVRATINLLVESVSRFGRIWGIFPEEAKKNLNFILE